MRVNQVKKALAEGKLQLGTGFAQFRSQDVVRILAQAGFHWAFIDTEHGGFDLETVQDLCRIAVLVGLVPGGACRRHAVLAGGAGPRFGRARNLISARGIAGDA